MLQHRRCCLTPGIEERCLDYLSEHAVTFSFHCDFKLEQCAWLCKRSLYSSQCNHLFQSWRPGARSGLADVGSIFEYRHRDSRSNRGYSRRQTNVLINLLDLRPADL